MSHKSIARDFRAARLSAIGLGYLPPEGSGIHTYLNGGQGLANSGDPGTYETGWDSTDWNSQVAPTDANLDCEDGYATWTNTAGTQENLPINCENWYEAYAFCIWDGGFLPSEAEWEYAAAGGSEQLEYPWGSTAPGTANQYAIYDCYYPSGTSDCTDGTGVANANIAPVGTATLGAGLWGQLDLAGNMFQWNLDSYDGYAYVDPCTDCVYLTPASYRVYRGGGFSDYAVSLLPPGCFGNTPSLRGYISGFRCARTP